MGPGFLAAAPCTDEAASWDTIWKWTWFLKDTWTGWFRQEVMEGCSAVRDILGDFHAKSLLDASCGLGWKTIVFAEMGLASEGADGSAVAIEHAPMLARESGLDLRFFASPYDELGARARRTYDCVLSDRFDWIRERNDLEAAARGIRSVLRPGGCFVFGAVPQDSKEDLRRAIEAEWGRQLRFVVRLPYERDGVRVTDVVVHDRLPEGVMHHRIFLIEEQGRLRLETAFELRLAKWTRDDYAEVLANAGFRDFSTFKRPGSGPLPMMFNVALA